MCQCRHTEAHNANECALFAVAHRAAAETIVVPQPLLTREEGIGLGNVETPLVLEPPDRGLSEQFLELAEVAVLQTAYRKARRDRVDERRTAERTHDATPTVDTAGLLPSPIAARAR